MQQQMNFLDSQYGKTFPAPSAATRERTSMPCSKPSAPSATVPLMYLDLRMGYGNLLGAYWETDTALPGGFTMPSTGACPKDARESTLSQILDLNAPGRYCLSPRACAGIIRRAEKRGKELPPMLRDALMEVIGLGGGLENIEDEPEDETTDLDDDDEDADSE